MSAEIAILLRPARAYSELAQRSGSAAWKRALCLAFFFGCAVSLATSSRVTPRLVVPVMLYASLIPQVEVAVLWMLLRRETSVGFGRAADLFLMGHAAWCLWLLAVAAIFAFADPIDALRWTGPPWGWGSLALVVVWSGYVDYCFFRCVASRAAGRRLVMQRAVCWGIGLLIFGGGSLWTGVLGILGQ